MTARDGVQIGLYLAALFALAWPLGAHMARVYEGKATFIYRVMGPIERLFFHAMGVRADDEASWKDYAFAAIAFNALGFFVVYRSPTAPRGAAVESAAPARSRARGCVQHRVELHDEHELAKLRRRDDARVSRAGARPHRRR